MTDAERIAALEQQLADSAANLDRAVAWINAWRETRERWMAEARETLTLFASAYLATLPREAGGQPTEGTLVYLSWCQQAADVLARMPT